MINSFNSTRTKSLAKVKGKLRELGITNRLIARRCGVSDSMVSMVLAGRATARHIMDAIRLEISARSR